jgi:hypothetical protein
MSDQTLLLLILVTGILAFAFGIWAGLGYPGLYDKYERTGRAPRESPLRWLVRGGRRPLTSEAARAESEEDVEEEDEEDEQDRTRPRFDRGRRFRR